MGEEDSHVTGARRGEYSKVLKLPAGEPPRSAHFADVSSEDHQEIVDVKPRSVSPFLGLGEDPPNVPRMGSVNGVQWAYANEDSTRDLVITRQYNEAGSLQWNVLLLLNGGAGAFTQRSANGLEGVEPSAGVTLAQLDGDGLWDLVVAPLDPASRVRIFLGYPTVDGIRYMDRTQTLDIPARGAQALAVADFNPASQGTGLADLFVGQSIASSDSGLIYVNQGVPGNSSLPLQVRLVAQGSGNPPDGLGAVIGVEAPVSGTLLTQRRAIDGGAGRGMQGAQWPVFATDSGASRTVTVTWPDGYVQTRSVLADSSLVSFVDDHFPAVENATVSASFEAGPGTADWIFSWETDYSSTRDEVEVWDGAKSEQGCKVGEMPDPQDPTKSLVLLGSQHSGVSVSVERIAGGTGRYRHTLRWSAVPCWAPCKYTYRVNSYSDTRRSSSAVKTFKVFVCAQIGE